jgi:hypothetical protein
MPKFKVVKPRTFATVPVEDRMPLRLGAGTYETSDKAEVEALDQSPDVERVKARRTKK